MTFLNKCTRATYFDSLDSSHSTPNLPTLFAKAEIFLDELSILSF